MQFHDAEASGFQDYLGQLSIYGTSHDRQTQIQDPTEITKVGTLVELAQVSTGEQRRRCP